MESTETPNAKSVLLLLTYLVPIVFIYTMMKKGDNPFFVAHSKNAAAYLLLLLVLWVLLAFVIDLGSLTTLVYLLAFIGMMYFGAYAAWQGKTANIPVITMLGNKIPLEKWFKKGAAPVSAPMASEAPSPAPVQEPMSTPEPTPAPMEPESPVTPETPVATVVEPEPAPAPMAPEAPSSPSEPSEPTETTSPTQPQA